MSGATVNSLTSGLSVQQKTDLAKPLALAYKNAMSNIGLDELKEVASDQAWSIVTGYFGIYNDIYELSNAFVRGEEGEFVEKLTDHFLGYLGLDQFKGAYDILCKLDNGRTAMALARDPAFKIVIGKMD
jgi:hypothetical protein